MTDFTFWGVIASPYQLKMQALADYAGHSWQRWPDQAPWLAGLRMLRRLEKSKKEKSVLRFPTLHPELDEYPEVPFYTEDGRQFYYDSTSLAYHLDQHPQCHDAPLLPEDPEQRFVCQLIDEAFDEFGLYMVHHNRWVISAKTNRMGELTGKEMGKLLPFGSGRLIARKMPRRQVRRCPYLFSVAPEGFDAGMSTELTPPAREGFPPTHDLLDSAWRGYLAAMEELLLHQPYLLGERFTLADASAYGQLSMNLIDGKAAKLLEVLAPTTFHWLCGIRDGAHIGSRGNLFLSDYLNPLLAVIADTFVPLMQQNLTAYKAATAQGENLFNEAAFDQGRALYDGELLRHPFRSVAKSFQVGVWGDLCTDWKQLDASVQGSLGARSPVFDNSVFAG